MIYVVTRETFDEETGDLISVDLLPNFFHSYSNAYDAMESEAEYEEQCLQEDRIFGSVYSRSIENRYDTAVVIYGYDPDHVSKYKVITGFNIKTCEEA